MQVRWLWLFVDALEPAHEQWEFWRAVTRSQFSPTRGDRDQFATLDPAGGAAWVKVQEVRSGGGIHLDLDVEDVAGATDFAADLGAQVVHRYPEGTVVILRSPGGFVFCVTAWHGEARQIRVGEPDLVDQITLDVPPEAYGREVAFWAQLLGIAPVVGSLPEFTVLPGPAQLPVRVMLQRREEGAGPVTGHLDLACADRAATLARHTGLGATVVADGPRWTVLADPAGQFYCLTDRSPATGVLPN